jgi:hypothetical protein
MATGALERAVRRAAARRDSAIERCGMCAAPVGGEHRHLLDDQDGSLLCACTPCSLLFERATAGGGHYRLIPSRRLRLAGVDVDPLNVPVGLVFFVKQGDGRVLAHYPSPLGTTDAEVRPEAWAQVETVLAGMAPRVEALLVRTNARRERDEHWLVPIDDCYRLVAVLRRHWTGMSGGSAVWTEIARFFDQLGGGTSRGG